VSKLDDIIGEKWLDMEFRAETKQQIKDLFIELVGDDQKEIGDFTKLLNYWKDELRQKVNKL
jgi:hypothetical protein